MDEKKILEENRRLFNKWANKFDFKPFQMWMVKFHEPIIKINLSGKKVLDISCGTGELLKNVLLKYPDTKLVGVDIAGEMLKKARKKLPKNVKLQKADVNKLPFNNESFDYVVSTEAFHHYYNQKNALNEMKRVTKKGGKVIIVDINFLFKTVNYIFQILESGCVKVNDKEEMRRKFKEAGFKKIKQKRNFLFSVMTVGEKQ